MKIAIVSPVFPPYRGGLGTAAYTEAVELSRLIVGKLEFQEIANPVLKYLVNPVLNIYWKIVRQLIFW